MNLNICTILGAIKPYDSISLIEVIYAIQGTPSNILLKREVVETLSLLITESFPIAVPYFPPSA